MESRMPGAQGASQSVIPAAEPIGELHACAPCEPRLCCPCRFRATRNIPAPWAGPLRPDAENTFMFSDVFSVSNGTFDFARTSLGASSDAVTRSSDAPASVFAVLDERSANFDDISARAHTGPRVGENNALVHRSSALRDPRAHERDDLARRFVVTEPACVSRIMCRHAGLNERTTLSVTLRDRVREAVLDFFSSTFTRNCIDRNHVGPFVPAFRKENFFLAATPSRGGINHGTVCSNSIPRGRTGNTFQSRARHAVRHRRESDPDGLDGTSIPSRPDFSSEGMCSLEESSIVDQGGPQ